MKKKVFYHTSSSGPEANLFETEDFLNLTPGRMSILLDDWWTNCSETELATAVIRWAARTWEWYDILAPGAVTLSPGVSGVLTPSSSRRSSDNSFNDNASFNDSGIVVSDEYLVEFSEEMLQIPSPPPSLPPPSLPPPPPGTVSPPTSLPGTSDDFTETPSPRSGRTTKTYKRRSRSSPRKAAETSTRQAVESSGKRKRKREDDTESETEVQIRGLAQVQQGQREISEVLKKLEFNNMEIRSLRGFLQQDIVVKVPEVYHHIRRLAGAVQYRCFPERGSKVSVSLCYHRCYRLVLG